MPYDLANHSIVRNGSITASVPRFNVSVNKIDPKTGAVLDTINTTFPALLSQFTNAQLEEPFKNFLNELAKIKFGD